MHWFLLVRSAEGKQIGLGDLVSVTNGPKVRSKLVFRFRDGSVDEETAVFLQRNVLELVSDHHVQKGPSFPEPLDLAFNVRTGETISRQMKDGKEEVKIEHMDLPNDLANGMVPLILENISPKTVETKVSYLTGTPKPRVAKLSIRPEGRDQFTVGGILHQADRFNIHIELGGVAGVIAPVIGKQPSDIHTWVVGDEVPTFLKMEGAFYEGGPIWTTEPTTAVWPKTAK